MAALALFVGWAIMVVAVMAAVAAIMNANDVADALNDDAGFQDYITALVSPFQLAGVGVIAAVVGYHLSR